MNSEIVAIRKQKLAEIRTAEAELERLAGELKSIDFVADELLRERKAPTLEVSSDNSESYSGLGATAAVKKLIQEYPTRWWAVIDMKDRLLANGYESGAKFLYNVIHATLERLTKDGLLEMVKTTKGKRYRLEQST